MIIKLILKINKHSVTCNQLLVSVLVSDRYGVH